MIDEKKALELIAQGEGQQVELKREVPSKVRELSEEVCGWFRWEDVSESAVRAFKLQAGLNSESPAKEFITNLGLLTDKGEITNAVPMLFSDACGKRFINAIIHCVRFKGTDNVHIIDSKLFEGPLLDQYNNATAWIKQYLAVEYVMHGFDPRQEIWELPLDAIKEALTNSICHRDYFDNGAKIMVELYDDRLEISNPGGLLSYVAEDFGHRSRSRNPLIFRMFTRMHLVESVGTGIPRIARLLAQNGFPPAEYKTEGFFTTILRKKPSASVYTSDHSGQKGGQKSGQVNKERIVELMRGNSAITTSEIANILGINRSAVMRHIETLKKEGVIERKGADRGGEWIVLR